jgi:hypothetical protein
VEPDIGFLESCFWPNPAFDRREPSGRSRMPVRATRFGSTRHALARRRSGCPGAAPSSVRAYASTTNDHSGVGFTALRLERRRRSPADIHGCSKLSSLMTCVTVSHPPSTRVYPTPTPDRSRRAVPPERTRADHFGVRGREPGAGIGLAGPALRGLGRSSRSRMSQRRTCR